MVTVQEAELATARAELTSVTMNKGDILEGGFHRTRAEGTDIAAEEKKSVAISHEVRVMDHRQERQDAKANANSHEKALVGAKAELGGLPVEGEEYAAVICEQQRSELQIKCLRSEAKLAAQERALLEARAELASMHLEGEEHTLRSCEQLR